MQDRTVSFGRYRLDPRVGLMSGAREVRLTPKALALLSYMAERPGEVITKEALFGAVWPEVAVGDAALVTCIQELRKALRDDARRPRYIETLHRRGYRFIAKATSSTKATSSAVPPVSGENALPLPDRPSIAVLPFANMSDDPDQDHVADGISEDLITGLSRIRWLFVIARNSSFVYRNRAVDVKDVSRALGVRYVLEGSVRRAGNRLRITAQLVDAISGGHHWAERYDREIGDIFAMQDEITRSVAAAIEPQLLAAEGVRALSRSADDLGAWELVARAQTHFSRMTKADYATAIAVLGRAVELYPDYAPARSLLAFSLAFAAHMGWTERDLLRGREHAVRAIALDERDPWGHIALGYWAMMERRTEESIAALRRAVELNPNSAAAHAHLSHGLAFAGHDGQAIAHAEEAIRLSPMDPLSALCTGSIAVAHFTAGRYREAARYTAEAARLRPGFQGAHRLHCASLALAGQVDEARGHFATVRREQPHLSAAWIRANIPYQTGELMERFLKGMRKAGLEDEVPDYRPENSGQPPFRPNPPA